MIGTGGSSDLNPEWNGLGNLSNYALISMDDHRQSSGIEPFPTSLDSLKSAMECVHCCNCPVFGSNSKVFYIFEIPQIRRNSEFLNCTSGYCCAERTFHTLIATPSDSTLTLFILGLSCSLGFLSFFGFE